MVGFVFGVLVGSVITCVIMEMRAKDMAREMFKEGMQYTHEIYQTILKRWCAEDD